MTKGIYTSHWEGGLGCRNKIKMSRYMLFASLLSTVYCALLLFTMVNGYYVIKPIVFNPPIVIGVNLTPFNMYHSKKLQITYSY